MIKNHIKNEKYGQFQIQTTKEKTKTDSEKDGNQDLLEWYQDIENTDFSDNKDRAFSLLQEIVTQYFQLHHPGLKCKEEPIWRLLKFGSSYLKTDDFQSDIDTILCTFGQVECAGNSMNSRMINILDHDNGSFFDGFYRFVKSKEEKGRIEKIEKIEEA